ncbi:MAG: universal stress protein [Alphaproteobacteria bacterium]|nr:universal stress protein [Alphaproteobacteria bacterium]
MTWKDVLVFADGTDSGVARAICAGEIAALSEADLAVCVLAEMTAMSVGGVSPAMSDAHEQARRSARDDAGRLLEAIESGAGSLSSRFAISVLETPHADASRLVSSLARSSDLVICAQPIDQDGTSMDETVLTSCLMGSGRPCLMLPRRPGWSMIGRRVLVCWNGSREASRAAHDALPLLAQAQAVLVMLSGPEDRMDGTDNGGLLRVCTHLSRHGVRVEGPETSAAAKGAGERILGAADEFGADLIVMGAFGRSPWRERMMGGVTRNVLRTTRLPVFLSH